MQVVGVNWDIVGQVSSSSGAPDQDRGGLHWESVAHASCHQALLSVFVTNFFITDGLETILFRHVSVDPYIPCMKTWKDALCGEPHCSTTLLNQWQILLPLKDSVQDLFHIFHRVGNIALLGLKWFTQCNWWSESFCHVSEVNHLKWGHEVF